MSCNEYCRSAQSSCALGQECQCCITLFFRHSNPLHHQSHAAYRHLAHYSLCRVPPVHCAARSRHSCLPLSCTTVRVSNRFVRTRLATEILVSGLAVQEKQLAVETGCFVRTHTGLLQSYWTTHNSNLALIPRPRPTRGRHTIIPEATFSHKQKIMNIFRRVKIDTYPNEVP